jgi:hypothetical protein
VKEQERQEVSMRTRFFLGELTAIGFALIAGACESAMGGSNDDFIPVISNIWHNVANDQHFFNLETAEDSVAEGSFTGTEEDAVLGTNAITGTWVHSKVEFTIARPSGDIKYSGRFTAKDTMKVASAVDALVIAK